MSEGASRDVTYPHFLCLRECDWVKSEEWKVKSEKAVLRRPVVRTRTSTTPVQLGSVRDGSVIASAVGYRRYYARVRVGKWRVEGEKCSYSDDGMRRAFVADFFILT